MLGASHMSGPCPVPGLAFNMERAVLQAPSVLHEPPPLLPLTL